MALSLFSFKNGDAMVILSCGLFRIFLDPPRFGSVGQSKPVNKIVQGVTIR
jgi:hypothetical protein